MGAGVTELSETLRRLVAIDSTSSRPNGAVIDLLSGELLGAGFSVERQAWRDDAGVEKQNLIGRAGPEAPGAGLALVGHTDTVPYDPDWGEALALGRDGDRLIGRGACDTKGFIACALEAARAFDLARLRAPLFLAFTADEEVGCLGAKRLADRAGFRPRHAIVGEPTSLTPIRAHKGYCLAEIRVRGVEGHSAYPATGESAIAGAAALLREIEAASAELAERPDPAFEPPHTTWNVGRIEGGKAKNIIPGECRLTLEWRPVPSEPIEEFLDRVRVRAKAVAASRPRLSIDVALLRADAGADTPADAPLVRFLEGQSGRPAATVSFGTEAPQLAAVGADAVVFGPGDIRVAHRTLEWVPAADLVRCTEILGRAIDRFCG